jgi:ribonuclease-3
MSTRDPSTFEKEHGLNFADKGLLKTAFVHSSYVNELDGEGQEDNERLEFLGDSVIGFVVSEWLFSRYPKSREGELTAMRAALVRKEALARFARKLNLGDFLFLGHGEEESGGRKRSATLCATFEALIGAMFLDLGMDAVRAFLLPIVQADIAPETLQSLHKDPKSRLQEWSQGAFGILPRYRLVDQSGPDHAKTFMFQVSIKEHRIGVGEGASKQDASLAAAAMALQRLGLASPEYMPNPGLEERFPIDAMEPPASTS